MSLYQSLKAMVRFEKIETNPVEGRRAHAASVYDLRGIAKAAARWCV
jgi:hypothetical protein